MEHLCSLNDNFDRTTPLTTSIEYNISSSKETIQLLLLIDKSMAFRVYDEFKNAQITLENEKLSVLVNMPKNNWLVNYLLGFGNTLEIVEPCDFRDEFRNLVKLILNKYL
jgi:predicted DNA-binding transcriptional regulator YafY